MGIRTGITGNVGSVPLQTLQEVTDTGNTTTNDIIVVGGGGDKVLLHTGVNMTAGVTAGGGGNLYSMRVIASNTTGTCYVQYDDSNGNTNKIIFAGDTTPNNNNEYNLRDIGTPVDIAFTQDLTTIDLQDVTDNGNTTTQDIIVKNGGTPEATMHADSSFSTVNVFSAGGAALQIVYDFGTDSGYSLYTKGAFSMSVTYNSGLALTSNIDINYRNTANPTEEVMYLSDSPHGNFTSALFVGTLITIPHGAGFTPTYGQIVAKNNLTALAVAGGYSVAYDPVNLVVTLSVNVALAIALDLDYIVFT